MVVSKYITASFREEDWPVIQAYLNERNSELGKAGKTRIEIRVLERDKMVWEWIADNFPQIGTMTNLIKESVREKIMLLMKEGKLGKKIERLIEQEQSNRPVNELEEMWASISGVKYVKKAIKSTVNQVERDIDKQIGLEIEAMNLDQKLDTQELMTLMETIGARMTENRAMLKVVEKLLYKKMEV